MDFVLTNKNRENTMFFPYSGYIDIEIGSDKNDMKVSIDSKMYDSNKFVGGGYIYQAGTEIGGLLNELESDTGNNEVSYTGPTFRGLMKDRFCEPPDGQDYRYISGELNQGIASICGSTFFGGLFRVSEASTGVTLSNIRINRDVTILEACNQFLSEANYKLKLSAVEYEDAGLTKFYVEVSSEAITDYSDVIEHSQDGMIDFVIKKSPETPYNYMLLLGKGELKERLRVRAKINSDGTLTEVQSFPDLESTRVFMFENVNTEEKDKLLEEGTEKVPEINNTDEQSITLSDSMKVWLGDIVGGRDYVTGKHISEPIEKIIYKLKYGEESLDYQIGGA